MKRTYRKSMRGLTLALVAILLHISVGATLAASPQVIAKLLTTGGQVKVNDNDTPSGSSIVSGATIETPANVGATIQVGDLGLVELPPGTIAIIEFAGSNIKVTLKQGCATLETNKGTTGSIIDYKGGMLTTNSGAEEGMVGDSAYRRLNSVTAKSDGTMRRRLPVCGIVPPGAAAVVAPAVLGPVLAGGGVAAATGLGAGTIAAIIAGIAGGAVIVGIVGTRGGNPSPSR